MKRQRAVVAGASFAGLVVVAMTSVSYIAAAATTKSEPSPASILIDAMDSELHRAMTSLGNTATDNTQQPKPYFLSYAVSDSDSIALTAQFGAIVGSNESRRRVADVQVRIGNAAQDNTHGDHRNSALTTVPLPLTDDGPALARSLWFATNRGYAKALDSYMKVKTEQQVRAKEEDGSPDFSNEKPATQLLPSPPPLVVDRPAWQERIRELSAIFKQYPDVFFNNVALEASTETDYFVSSEGAKVATPNHVARLIIVARTRAADGMDLFRAETCIVSGQHNIHELGRQQEVELLLAAKGDLHTMDARAAQGTVHEDDHAWLRLGPRIVADEPEACRYARPRRVEGWAPRRQLNVG